MQDYHGSYDSVHCYGRAWAKRGGERTAGCIDVDVTHVGRLRHDMRAA